MKKREQKFSTEHFDAVLVTHEPEEKDLAPGYGVNAILPEDYLLIGPPGGQLARVEGVEIALLQTLISCIGFGNRRMLRPMGPPCPVHG